MSPELRPALVALAEGRNDEAIAILEALADRGVLTGAASFDRGIAYARRAQSPAAREGDLGRAAHAFEEVLRLDPHDRAASELVGQIRREIARRDARQSGRAEVLGEESPFRAIVTAAHPDVWLGAMLLAAMVLTLALLVRQRLVGATRRAASTVAVVALVVAATGAALAGFARDLRLHLREAIVVVPRPSATGADGAPFDLDEGARVDVVEVGATAARIRTEKGEAWVPRAELRALPPYR